MYLYKAVTVLYLETNLIYCLNCKSFPNTNFFIMRQLYYDYTENKSKSFFQYLRKIVIPESKQDNSSTKK